jgi:hypothetical protein
MTAEESSSELHTDKNAGTMQGDVTSSSFASSSGNVLVFPVQERSWISILMDGLKLYYHFGMELTLALLIPILLIVAGSLAAPLLPIYAVNYLMEQYHIQDVVLLLGLMGVFMIPGFYFFFTGFWQYLVYLASFNKNIVAFQQGKTLSIKEASEPIQKKSGPYSSILCFFAVILLLPMLGFVLPQVFWPGSPGDAYHWVWVTALSLALGGILLVVSLVFSVYCCLPIQIAAFEEIPMNPIPTFKKSVLLVWGNFGRVLAISFCVTFVTTFFIPMAISSILDFLHLTEWLSKTCVEGIMTDLIRYTISPDLQVVRQFDLIVNGSLEEVRKIVGPVPGAEKLLFGQSFSIVSLFSQISLSFGIQAVIAGLLTPLGTIWYCLLYQDLMLKKGNNIFQKP